MMSRVTARPPLHTHAHSHNLVTTATRDPRHKGLALGGEEEGESSDEGVGTEVGRRVGRKEKEER